jgi:8-oxo-dGTP diphosphatase
VAKLPHWDGDLIFLAILERGAPFFSLKLTYKGSTLTEALLNEEPVTVKSVTQGIF